MAFLTYNEIEASQQPTAQTPPTAEVPVPVSTPPVAETPPTAPAAPPAPTVPPAKEVVQTPPTTTGNYPSFFATDEKGITGFKEIDQMTPAERTELQRFVNQVNGKQVIAEDGLIGPKTAEAVNNIVQNGAAAQYIAKQKWGSSSQIGQDASAVEGSTPAPTPTTKAAGQGSMRGGIDNQAVATKTTTTDISGVQKQTLDMMQAMKEQGLTFAQAFDKFYPKPTRNTNEEDRLRNQEKFALIADALRLATEGYFAGQGANVQKRDQSQPYASLQKRLANEYAMYLKQLNDWQAKGFESTMGDVKTLQDLYGRNLANAPKTTVEDKSWERKKWEDTQAAAAAKAKQAMEEKEKDRLNAIKVAGIKASNKTTTTPKDTTYGDPNKNTYVWSTLDGEKYSIPKSQNSNAVDNVVAIMAKDTSLKADLESLAKQAGAVNTEALLSNALYKQTLEQWAKGNWHRSKAAKEYITKMGTKVGATPQQSPSSESSTPPTKKSIPGVTPVKKKKIAGF